MKTVCHRYALFVVTLFAVLLTSGAASARKETFEIRRASDKDALSGSAPGTALITEQVLGEWDFESPAHGWVAEDLTAQTGNFTHISNFAGVAGYLPISGFKSLWCGTPPGDCGYQTLPGYGNSWDQRFTSVELPWSGGDVNVSFTIRYDCEPTYDFVRLEYQSGESPWMVLAEFTGSGLTGHNAVIPDGALAATFRLRFRFTSDAVYSDEDGFYNSIGAYVLDNLSVSDNGGIINSQNFEAEPSGVPATQDGTWNASPSPTYGVHAALMNGAGVLQEDPETTNVTQLWGFFENSSYNYACGGHVEQLVVPYAKNVDGEELHFKNAIISPPIGVVQDANGFPIIGPISMTADIYHDLDLDALVLYQYRVRSLVNGCWHSWWNNGIFYYHPDKVWSPRTLGINPLIEPGATQIQVSIAVMDMCETLCGVYGTGSCHSHGPLVDNVKVYASPGPQLATVTNTNDSGAGSLRQAILNANANADFSGIAFDIPGFGPHEILLTSPLPAITARVTIDGYTQPGAAENPNGPWQGSDAIVKIWLDGNAGYVQPGLDIQANGCRVRGLWIRDFSDAAIRLTGDGNIVEGCFIGLGEPAEWGIVASGESNMIGGDSPADMNVISGNLSGGVHLMGLNNTVEGNFIGPNASGTAPIGGNPDGIRVSSGSQTIRGNLISGNGKGITLSYSVSGAHVLGNRIGTAANGTSPLGNSFEGIFIDAIGAMSGDEVHIGSVLEPNLIAFNAECGIQNDWGGTGAKVFVEHNDIYSNGKGVIVTSTGSSTTLSMNSIHQNLDVGIDLSGDGITGNDPDDSDVGPNGLQNFPTLNGVFNLPTGGVIVNGMLTSEPNQPYKIEFFASQDCDLSAFGEGSVYLGNAQGLANGAGQMPFGANLELGVPGGWTITATATNTITGATSEFSACMPYTNTPFGTGVVVYPVDPALMVSPVKVIYEGVTFAGNTSLSLLGIGPPPPGGFTFGDSPVFYDLSTTASYEGTVTVCISYDESDFSVPESELKVLHYNGTSWDDVTTSLDTNANILCGATVSLSPFAIAWSTGPTAVPEQIPAQFALHPCAPNPFNPNTTIRYDVPSNGARVAITIFDVAGRRVRALVDGARPAGQQRVSWDGRDDAGRTVASGVYFYRMSSGSFTQTRKMVLLK